MQKSAVLLDYVQQGVDRLLAQGHFDGGQTFRPTQSEALTAYQRYLHDESLSAEERLKGFFEIPTGIGKTALFVGIIAKAHAIAEEQGETLKTAIAVPTTVLLEQTAQDIRDFAPDFAATIGFYGDGDKDLGQDVTIMTYNAWLELTEDGTIGSHMDVERQAKRQPPLPQPMP